MKHAFSHALWGCLVIAAYLVGSMRSSNRDGLIVEGPRPSKKPASVLEPGTDRRTKSSPSVAVKDVTDPFKERRPLDSEAIITLGQQFTDARHPTEGRLAYARLLEGLTSENALQIREQLLHLDPMSAEFREFHYAWGETAGLEAVLHGTETPERDVAVTLAGWARAEPEAAMEWVSSIKEDTSYNQADLEYGIAHGLSLTDPDAAGAYISSVADGDDTIHAEKMLGMVTAKLFQAQGPSKTAAWAQGLPNESAIRTTALQRVFEQWTQKDPESVSSHLVEMPPSQDRDTAIGGFVSRLVREDPVSAITWASEIADGQTQERVLVSLGRTYFKGQPQAAEEWLQTADLSPQAREQILNAPE